MNFKFNMDSHPHQNHHKNGESSPSVADIVGHGGIYKLLDADYLKSRLRGKTLKEGTTVDEIIAAAQENFYRIVDSLPYIIPTSLVSHISSPIGGKTFSALGEPNDNDKIPAFMTFIGQFLDHDLTQNMANLLDPQSGANILNGASLYIDLDSVYSRSNALTNGSLDDIFDENRKFRLREVFDNKGESVGFDHQRDEKQFAYIMDKRNEDNQIISQIHILIERLHNKLMDIEIKNKKVANGGYELRKDEIFKIFNEVKTEVTRNWQSFVLYHYLTTIVSDGPLNRVLLQFNKHGYGDLEHKPDSRGKLNIPHEFSIAFRMGHSMLRDKYHLRPNADPIDLFNARTPAPCADDLAGGKHLTSDHVIDWKFFSATAIYSNKIDSKVTIKVFDLPVSTIPDMAMQIVNLPQRNLIRSSQVNLTHAEHIIDKLNEKFKIEKKPLIKKLGPDDIEPNIKSQELFRIDNDGNYNKNNPFRTPLWYYVLKEAEVQCGGAQLGELGGRLVAEVIAGGIYYSKDSFLYAKDWKSRITPKPSKNVQFIDIVNFVLG